MKKIIIILLVVIVIVVGFIKFKNKNNKNADVMQMQYENVERGDLKVTVSATGIIKPELSADISPEAEQRGAKIVSLRIEEGDFVTKGQVIAELDKSSAMAVLKGQQASLNAAKSQLGLLVEGSRKEDIEKAQADLDSVQSKYLDAKQNYQKTQELFDKGYVSEQEKISAKTNLDIAENNIKNTSAQLKLLKAGSRKKEIEKQKSIVQQAEANYEQANAAYKSNTIYSPISGVVTSKQMQEGQIVYPGSIIAKVSDLNTLQVVADVDETDIGGVKIGSPAEITFEALPELTLKGLVAKISSEAKVKQDITYFEVTIELKDKNQKLKPGMTTDVEIIIRKSLATLTVSSTAVKRDKDGGYLVLLKVKDNFVPRKVEVGLKTQDKYEILKGLKEGDVIVSNYALIKKDEDKPNGIFGQMGGPRRPRRQGNPH